MPAARCTSLSQDWPQGLQEYSSLLENDEVPEVKLRHPIAIKRVSKPLKFRKKRLEFFIESIVY
jgi:hypothetical protein